MRFPVQLTVSSAL